MQTSTGNLVNDLRWGAETIPGLETRRWTGYIDVKETDAPGKWYAISLPNTGRNDELAIPDRVMVLPTDYKINHFAVTPHVQVLAETGTVVQLSLRNPGFLSNEKNAFMMNGQGEYLTPLFLRETRFDGAVLPNPPYLAHQVWIKLLQASPWSGRLYISIGAFRKSRVFDFFVPGREPIGALIWGERRNGSIGNIPGSEGFGDDGIRPGGRDFPSEDFFSVSPGSAEVTPGQTITFYSTGPATWALVGGGTLSSTTGNQVTYTAPATVGTATITVISTDDPTVSIQVPLTISSPTITNVNLTSDQSALLVGGTANLSATVTGTGAFNPNVNWTFTGPATLAGSGNNRVLAATGVGTITVTATSVQDPTKSKTITIASSTPIPVVSGISLNSDKYSMTTLQTALLTASVVVDNNGDPGVLFSISGPGSLSGTGNTRTMTPNGAGTVSVTATSIQDPTKTATISIAVNVGVSVTSVTLTGAPSSNSPLGVTNLLATVNGTGAYDASVNWSIVSGPGLLTPGSYSSPTTSGSLTFAATPATGSTTVRATSVADPTKFADFVVTLGPDPLITSITVTPSVTTIAPGGTFSASAVVNPNTRSQAVTWSVSGPASLLVTAGVPTITATGPGVISVTATSVANPGISGTATVNSAVVPVVTSVLAFRATSGGALDSNPQPVPGGTSTFASATVYGSGPISSLVSWSIVSGGGTLVPQSPNIVQYTAPAVTVAGQSATLRATSVTDPSKFGDLVIGFDTTVSVTSVVWNPDGPIDSTWYFDDLAPLSGSVNVLGTGAYNSDVTFTVPSGVTATPGVESATSTPVTLNFAATNSQSPTSYTIRATSVQDPTKFDDLVVNRIYALRPIAVSTGYLDRFRNAYPQNMGDPVPPVLEVGETFFVEAAIVGTVPTTANPVTWTVTGPATFTADVVPSTNYDRLRLVMNSAGTVTVTATSTYDPTKSSTKTITVVAVPVVTSVSAWRPDGRPLTSAVYKGSPSNPEKNLVVFSAKALGTNLANLSATDQVLWTIVSGPGVLGDPTGQGLPIPGSDPFYSTTYHAPSSSPVGNVTLRATSFQDPSKFATITFPLQIDPPGDVANFTSIYLDYPANSIPATNPATIDTNYWMPGASAPQTDIRRNLLIKSSVSGSGLGLSQGTTVTIVSGSSVATLTPIPTSGPVSESYYNLTRIGTQSGWVKIRSASTFNPAIFTEEAFYFRPQVFTIVAVMQYEGLSGRNATVPADTRSNALRIYNGGALTEPIVVTSVNCTVGPSIEPGTPLPELDTNGRAYATSIFMDAVGPYSVTAYPVSNPAAAQTVTFSKAPNGDILGDTVGSPFGFSRAPWDSTSFSISPAIPPKPALTRNP